MQGTALLNEFAKQCRGLSPRRWVIGLSGGLDSVVLLHLAIRQLPSQQIHVLHINHQLQADAPHWVRFCEALAHRYHLAFTALTVTPNSASEADARAARYHAFESFLQQGDLLLLGQHANDQAETLLFRLMRGSGLRGLAGMPRIRTLARGQLLRPLLSCTREQLEQWACEQALSWIEDPSNQNTAYDRNYLRHQVVPALIQRWPQAVEQVSDCAQRLAEDQALLESYQDEALAKICEKGALSIPCLLALPKVQQQPLLRHWAYRQSSVLLGARHLESLWQLVEAGSDKAPQLQVGALFLRRYRTQLYCVNPVAEGVEPFAPELGEYCLPAGRLSVVLADATEPRMRLKSLSAVRCVSKQEGMRCRPVGRPEKSLKKLFQEAGIPPWQREQWPVFIAQNTVVAVPGICVCEDWQAKPEDTGGYLLSWQPF